MAFRHIRSEKKWIRIHQQFEWPDYYSYQSIEELKRFYDRYTKNIHNGWEMTPKVRIEVMDAYDCVYQVNRPEKDFPIPRTEYRKLYLDAAGLQMSYAPYAEESSESYNGNTGEINFDYTFEEDVELTGYLKLHLWVQADGHDDMDLFVNIKKLDTQGNELPIYIFENDRHPGAWGKLRVSQRKLDEDTSTEFQPIQIHDEIQKLSPGEIVPVDIEINPHSRIWHKGQKIRIQIAGRYIRDEWFEKLHWATDNKGNHVIHTGGNYDSYLQIPVIPPKYCDGEYVYR